MDAPFKVLLQPQLRSAVSRLFSSPGRNWLDSRAGKGIYVGIHGVLVALIALTFASMIKPLLRRHAAVAVTVPANAPQPTQAPSVERIIAAHLFGQPVAAQQTNAVVASGPPPGDIKVEGIVYASNKVLSRAILTIDGRPTVVGIGDSLPGGSKVIAIEANHVLLGQTNAPASLPLDFASGGDDSSGTSIASLNLMHGSNLPSMARDSAAASGDAVIAPALNAPDVPVTASPLAQMRALRSQLVHGHPKHYLDRSRLVLKSNRGKP